MRQTVYPKILGWPWLTAPLLAVAINYLLRGTSLLNPAGRSATLTLADWWGYIYFAAATVIFVCVVANRWTYRAQIVAGVLAVMVSSTRGFDLLVHVGWSGRHIWTPFFTFSILCLFLFINPVVKVRSE